MVKNSKNTSLLPWIIILWDYFLNEMLFWLIHQYIFCIVFAKKSLFFTHTIRVKKKNKITNNNKKKSIDSVLYGTQLCRAFDRQNKSFRQGNCNDFWHKNGKYFWWLASISQVELSQVGRCGMSVIIRQLLQLDANIYTH